jgi:hypothetical protein
MWEIYAFAGIVNLTFTKKKLHYYYRFSDRPIDRHGVLPKRVRILWDWEDLKDGDSGWPAAQPIRQNPGSEGLIRFRHRIYQAIPITVHHNLKRDEDVFKMLKNLPVPFN